MIYNYIFKFNNIKYIIYIYIFIYSEHLDGHLCEYIYEHHPEHLYEHLLLIPYITALRLHTSARSLESATWYS